MLKRILGLDLGISSIGWGLIDFDDEEFINEEINDNGESEIFAKQGKIIDCGVRIFDPCENTKDKSPSALPRRTARLNRRRLARKSYRCRKIREMCESAFNITLSDDVFKNKAKNENFKDVWVLRKEALERKLNEIEISRVLCHIVKHRGWASRSKSEEKDDKNAGAMKSAIEDLKSKLIDGTTAGYYYGKIKAESNNFDNEKIINEDGKYDHCIGRKQNEDELNKIFEKQKEFGCKGLSDNFRDEVIRLFSYEKEMQSMKEMVGHCPFEKTEYRAPKESYSAELFNVYTKINNLKVLDVNDAEYDEKFKELVNLFKETKDVKYKDIRKKLKLNDDFKFKGLDYYQAEYVEFKKEKGSDILKLSKDDEKKIEEYKQEGFEIEYPDKPRKVFFRNDKGEYKYKDINEIEKEKLYSMVGYHTIKKTLTSEQFKIIESNPFMIDTIMEGLAYEKGDKGIEKYIKSNNPDIPDDIIKKCEEISTSKFIHISCKAIKKLLPFLEKGLTYDKACKECGYEFKDDVKENLQNFLPTIEKYTENTGTAKLTNPVDRRTISQTRKVINAIIRKYGAFDQINIEFARDLGKSADERMKIEKGQKTFKELKDKLRDEVAKILDINPDLVSDKQILKLRLYNQQDGKSMYSYPLNDLPTLKEILTDDKCCEIDHILPYSKSFDDSLNNKVLVLPQENQNKKNRIPYEFLKDNWEEWKKQIWSIQGVPYIKKKNLTTEDYNFIDKWKARNLCDTSYISRYLTKYLLKNLKFKKNDKIKNKIQARPGQLTSYLRHLWGVGEKVRSDGDTHHMVDALIIACATQSMCQLISSFHANERGERVEEQQKTIADKIEKLKESGNNEEIKEQIKELEEKKKWYNLIQGKNILQDRCKLDGVWDGFVREVDDKVNGLTEINTETGLPKDGKNIVSRMARRKITGEAHKATIEGFRQTENGDKITISKTKLNKLTLKNIENLQDKDGNSKNLYNILKQRLEEFNGDAEKAFKEPIYMSGEDGNIEGKPQIKSVKLISNYTGGGVKVNNGNGIAENSGMPRVDIFCKDGKYYAVPIYIANFVKNELPTKSKPHDIEFPFQPKEDDKFYNECFKFSLFKDELIFIEHKNGEKFFGYFIGYALHQKQGQICFENTDTSPFGIVNSRKNNEEKPKKQKDIDINVIKSLRKFQVDPLGYISEIKQEKRRGIIRDYKKNKN